jgi:hypothetical protein
MMSTLGGGQHQASAAAQRVGQLSHSRPAGDDVGVAQVPGLSRPTAEVVAERTRDRRSSGLIPGEDLADRVGIDVTERQVGEIDGGEAGDVFATSLAILNLQAAYRYLPLAGAR